MSHNIGRCTRCNKTLIREEYDTHTCTPELRDVRHIRVDYWYLSQTEDGRPLIIAKGLDGILYRLSGDRKREFEVKTLADETYHDQQTDDNLPEPC